MDCGLPSRSICRSSRTRNSLTWMSVGRSPISSRKIVDWSASFEASDLPRQRARERALLAAEQLALHQGGWESPRN